MGIALFMTLVFLHIALGLALAFLVMHFAFKSEHKALKNFGFIVGYLLIVLALLTMLLGTIFVATKSNLMSCPYKMHEKNEQMMQQGMPMMNEQKEEDKEEIQEQKTEQKHEKNIAYKQQMKKESKGCPVKTRAQIEQELKTGKITGAACSTEMKKSAQTIKNEKK
ncbi:MAG: hypothetical protein A2039_10190 [Candidatus Melainabacteria bacterium GWA2_34_9]|nr:MAG: hypothetical protein A2039_10190 [Candidatus Melainabacteria bacterium GWA2_34_9]